MRRIIGVVLLLAGALIGVGASASSASPPTDWIQVKVSAGAAVQQARVTYSYTITPDGSGPAVIGQGIGSPNGGGFLDIHSLSDEVALRASTPAGSHEVEVIPNGVGGYTTTAHLFISSLTDSDVFLLNFVDGASISGLNVSFTTAGLTVASTSGSGTQALIVGGPTDTGASAGANSPLIGASTGASHHSVDMAAPSVGVVSVDCAACAATWALPGGGGGSAASAGVEIGRVDSQLRAGTPWFGAEAGTYTVDWLGADYALLFEAPVVGALVPVGDTWTVYAP